MSAATDDGALLRLYGTAEPPPEERLLRAGPLTAIFTGGNLRSIKVRGVEVVRGLYFLIRDSRWGTVVPELTDVRVEESAGRFAASFKARGRSDGGDLDWEGTIEGSAAGGLTFRCRGTPRADFTTCRTGFIVLHPLEGVAGCPAWVGHSDGRVEATRFPDEIDPLQSFLDVRAITHEPLPGVKATVRMEGDAPWETEDHRNWLDASFKTYFRPLALPWPYVVPAGTPIDQTITLTFEPSLAGMEPAPEGGPVTVAVGDRSGAAMPEVGLAVRPQDLDACEAALPHLGGLDVQYLAFRVASDTPDLPGVMRRYAALAAALDAEPWLEIVVAGADRAAAAVGLDLVAVAADAAGLVPGAVAVTTATDLKSYPPSVDRPPSLPLRELYEAAREAFPGLPLGGGMFSFFTELNRRRPPGGLLDFVQHATASIVHAADDRSVMETLESLPHVFRSARAFLGDGTPYVVGPAQIGMAFNPYGASTAPNPERVRRTMVTDDPRAGALFGAAWAAGYLARAAAGGLHGVTIAAPGGPFGVAGPDGPRPALHVIRAFAAGAGAPILACASSDPQRVLACACARGARRALWLANLTSETQEVALAGLRPSRTLLLDGSGEPREVPDGPASLPPYAVAFVEG
jgi:D-apionolactonase